MASEKNRRHNQLKEHNPDWDWDYWEAQVEGYSKAFKKPIWRDYLQTQREKMDKVHDFFWDRTLNGGERQEEKKSRTKSLHTPSEKLSPPVPPVNKAEG